MSFSILFCPTEIIPNKNVLAPQNLNKSLYCDENFVFLPILYQVIKLFVCKLKLFKIMNLIVALREDCLPPPAEEQAHVVRGPAGGFPGRVDQAICVA